MPERGERFAVTRRSAAPWLLIAVVLVAACRPELLQGAPSESEPPASAILSTARRLAISLPEVRTEIELAPGDPHGWWREGDRAASKSAAATSRWSASLPPRANGAWSVSCGESTGPTLRVRWEGTAAAELQVRERVAIYPSAHPSTDALVTTGERQTRVLYVLHGPDAPRRWRWLVERDSGTAMVRAAADGAVEFADSHGDVVMRAPPGIAVDANGVRFPVRVRWDEAREALAYEMTGEPHAWPVLVDPVIEGIDWALRDTTAGAAPARASHAAVYDTVRRRILVFGGFDSVRRFDDIWEWDGAMWSPVPASAPPLARYSHGLAYDSARRRVVLFGGSGVSTRLGDTWEWDGMTWTPRTGSPSPPARYRTALAYDARRERVVLFGGVDTSVYGDTWDWDGTTWTPHTGAPAPPARHAHAMAYDAARERIVLFGGFGASCGCRLGDTWEWDGTNWAPRTSGTTPPSARQSHAMAYDVARQRVVLFGGQGIAGNLADTWEWDGSNWTPQTTATAPSARVFTAMASDARGRVTLFGGQDTTIRGDTWELRTTRLRGSDCAAHAECQTGHCIDGVCCDSTCGNGVVSDCQACSRAAGALADGVCGPVAAGRICRIGVDVCDAVETCNGTSMACPADVLAPVSQSCRPSAGDCDVAETCTGASAACPVDRFAGGTLVCRPSKGRCDIAEVCAGGAATCPADRLSAASEVCRPAAGDCDTDETCTGSAPDCPPDVLVANTQVCRPGAGDCDVAERCTGTSASCPPDALAMDAHVCRVPAGVCDLPERCDGIGAACPVDGFASSAMECRSSVGACDLAERCTGDNAACPTEAFRPLGVSCADANRCDGDETCDGAGACVRGAPIVCPPPTSPCVSARCESASGTCVSEPRVAGTACDDGDPCNGPEACNGSGACTPDPGTADAGTGCDAGGTEDAPADDGADRDAGSSDVIETRDAIDEADATNDAGAIVDVVNRLDVAGAADVLGDIALRVDVAHDGTDAGSNTVRTGCGCHIPATDTHAGDHGIFASGALGFVCALARRRRSRCRRTLARVAMRIRQEKREQHVSFALFQ